MMLTRCALAARYSLAIKALSICLVATPAWAPTLAPGALAQTAFAAPSAPAAAPPLAG